jgi:hypothetical protein
VEHNEDVIKLAIAYLMKAVALPKTDVRIACDVEFGTVMLGIDGHCPSQSEAPLASYLTLARVLLDAQGCSMKVVARPSGWRISVGLADAAQPELALF